MYPVIIASITEYDMVQIDELAPVATLEEAKEKGKQAGFTILDIGEGGNCETAWDDSRGTVHVITVEPIKED